MINEEPWRKRVHILLYKVDSPLEVSNCPFEKIGKPLLLLVLNFEAEQIIQKQNLAYLKHADNPQFVFDL